jgi:hypothetical protein
MACFCFFLSSLFSYFRFAAIYLCFKGKARDLESIKSAVPRTDDLRLSCINSMIPLRRDIEDEKAEDGGFAFMSCFFCRLSFFHVGSLGIMVDFSRIGANNGGVRI